MALQRSEAVSENAQIQDFVVGINTCILDSFVATDKTLKIRNALGEYVKLLKPGGVFDRSLTSRSTMLSSRFLHISEVAIAYRVIAELYFDGARRAG